MLKRFPIFSIVFLFIHGLSPALAECTTERYDGHRAHRHPKAHSHVKKIPSNSSGSSDYYKPASLSNHSILGLYNPNTIFMKTSLETLAGVSRQANSGGKVYNLTLNSSGNKFFDDWDFFSEADPTHGLVDYQTAEEAWKNGLISVGPSSVDKSLISATMKVDNKSWLQDGQLRPSVRVSSKKTFKYGLLVLDAIKMPFGCSTWPAFWTVGTNWPLDGEIDIVEGVNMLNTNQMTLHTGPGCTVKNPMSNQAVGNVIHSDCDVYSSENLGCGVLDHSNTSFGEPFNLRGGGVFAMEWADSGISIWRFNRGEVPQDLQSGNNPQPSTWAIRPLAHWSNSQCNDLSQTFSEHRVIFDITLCGDWAGSAGVFNANNACTGSCESMVKDPTNYNNAQWEIASVKLYQ